MTRKEIENLITTVIRQNDMRNRQGKNLLDVFNGLLDYIQSESEESGEITDIRNLLNTCVGLPAYDSSSYKITFTTIAGAYVEIDLPIEQLALRYNPETESIEFDNHDGTTTSIPVGWEEYTPVPEPKPDPEQLREMAYRAEADQYLMAYEGYLVEGKILEADEQKALYLAKKAEIRERYPDK